MKTAKTLLLLIVLSFNILNAQEKQTEFPKLSGEYLGAQPPGSSATIFAQNIVSSVGRAMHSTLAVSPDGTEIFWAVTMPFEIYYSKLENGYWTKPVVPEFVKGIEATSPFFSPDGKKLFFTSQNIENMNDPANRKFYIWLWYVEKKDGKWGEAKKVEADFNNGNIGYAVSLTQDGTLYFSSDGVPGGKGGEDIYYSKLIDGKYSKPVSVGEEINSEFTESNVYIAPDENYVLYAITKRNQGLQKNFWMSIKNKEGKWSKPIDIGNLIGEKDTGHFIGVSTDQKYLFYTSLTPTKRSNLYWVDISILNEFKTINK
jgi:hypothetical protein